MQFYEEVDFYTVCHLWTTLPKLTAPCNVDVQVSLLLCVHLTINTCEIESHPHSSSFQSKNSDSIGIEYFDVEGTSTDVLPLIVHRHLPDTCQKSKVKGQ